MASKLATLEELLVKHEGLLGSANEAFVALQTRLIRMHDNTQIIMLELQKIRDIEVAGSQRCVLSRIKENAENMHNHDRFVLEAVRKLMHGSGCDRIAQK
ncbi:hypothetical protein CYMTET_41443 [Cymbomonas tetramitiformis]|uniref:Uncharacterized protein n=1 Tax=Cymbomonas tetramitiformis TaxID=36881 RepID=A0AAE0C639_9CHLO|nr:hypothetical protein CYMTET_41443 [Cymbomonas tetramitiformis]